jgi:poly(hydroxyalkanoate) granule-associated protein
MSKKSTDPQSQSPDDAQQIWLAGLGAFSQAQKKGTEALQKMLQDGLNLQRQAQQTAEQKIADATRKMSAMAQQISPATKAATQAPMQAPWEGLEGLFDQRVARALERLGWGSPERMTQLQQRVEALEDRSKGATAANKTTTRPAAKTARKPRNG